MSKYWQEALFYNKEQIVEGFVGNDGLLVKLTTKNAALFVEKFYTENKAEWYFNQTKDRLIAEEEFGYVIGNELKNIDNMLEKAEKPFTAIMGGAKVSGKIDIIKHLLPKVDNLIIGGGMTYTFIKAQGGKIGTSLVEDDKLEMSLEIMELAKKLGVKLHLAVDALNADDFSNDANTYEGDVTQIKDGWMGLDIGPKTIKQFIEVINNSKTILWNGPVGVFEMEKFEKGTKTIALAITEATKKGAFSLIGGGDSVAAINKYGLADKVSYVSTGGGALLEYMEGKELPGIKAIRA